ncbi:ABC transporter permease subunit [Natronohydrobacter thiooxidans]|uniref:ABC transporter permease subunit n=1 Tax=Natronohydrobacter thiooxidans TaxID=87172 RepID=UPI0008FF70E0|nr:ABC transporter permease subunit [Natronohydrobacter thiooxidans]
MAAVNARITRDAMASVAAQPFYAFAQWKGLSRTQVLWRHGLRNVSVPLLTYLVTDSVHREKMMLQALWGQTDPPIRFNWVRGSRQASTGYWT